MPPLTEYCSSTEWERSGTPGGRKRRQRTTRQTVRRLHPDGDNVFVINLMLEIGRTFGDEFEGELDVQSVGAVQIPGHQHTHAILHRKHTPESFSLLLLNKESARVTNVAAWDSRTLTPLKMRAVPDLRGSPLRVPLSAPYTSGHVSCCRWSLKSSLRMDGRGDRGTQWAPP